MTIALTREEAQQVLDALEDAADHIGCPDDDDAIGIARRTLRARFAQPEPEPVAWLHRFIEHGISIGKKPVDLDKYPDRWMPVYKDPTPCQTCEALARTVMMDQTSHDTPQREWQGLTNEEIHSIPMLNKRHYARAMEAKLKAKNAP
jgi:hypothetical protein